PTPNPSPPGGGENHAWGPPEKPRGAGPPAGVSAGGGVGFPERPRDGRGAFGAFFVFVLSGGDAIGGIWRSENGEGRGRSIAYAGAGLSLSLSHGSAMTAGRLARGCRDILLSHSATEFLMRWNFAL